MADVAQVEGLTEGREDVDVDQVGSAPADNVVVETMLQAGQYWWSRVGRIGRYATT